MNENPLLETLQNTLDSLLKLHSALDANQYYRTLPITAEAKERIEAARQAIREEWKKAA